MNFSEIVDNLSGGVLIVAEISANHGSDINIAIETIKAAKNAGANAIKIQTYTADTLTIDCNKEYFKIQSGTIWDGKNLYKLYEEAYTPWEWTSSLKKICDELGLLFFSTPFDNTAVDFLEEYDVPFYKIASFELTDIPLIKYVASKNKPIIMSVGISDFNDIDLAVATCRSVGNNDIILLQCTSQYPAKLEDSNLLTMVDMKTKFECEIGLSDHTEGSAVAQTAVALGAKLIEKHFILDRSIGGPDASFSMEPSDFAEMVRQIRMTQQIMGKIDYSLTDKKLSSRKFSRSLFIVEDVKKGDRITLSNIRSIRPGDGIHTKYLDEILGKTFNDDYERGEPLQFNKIRGMENYDE